MAPGSEWIAGWPPPNRLPSSTSRATPAVAFTSVAVIGSALRPWPNTVAAADGERCAILDANAAFSGCWLPTTMAPRVSSVTSRTASSAPGVSESKPVSLTKSDRVSR